MKNLIGILIVALNLTFSCSAQNDWKLIEKTILELKGIWLQYYLKMKLIFQES